MDDVTVLGGGIGGLACAIALAQRGARVRVLEQALSLREVGAGIQISPNGMTVLRALGLEPAFAALSTGNRAVELRQGHSGRRLIRMTMGDGFRFVHRADMITLLADGARAAGVLLETGQRVASVMLDPNPRLTFADGRVEDAGFLVGADGVRSVLRPVMNGPGAPFFTGQVAWRALIAAADPVPAEATVFVGPGRHLVRYPLAGRSVVNLVGVEERATWAADSWSAQDDPAHFRAAFSGFCDEVQRDLAQVDQVNIWGLFRHPVAAHWYQGHSALIGMRPTQHCHSWPKARIWR